MNSRSLFRLFSGRKAAGRLLASALLLAAAPAFPQAVSFKILPPSSKPKLAQPFKLRVEVSYPADYSVRPDTANFQNDVFELLRTEKVSSKTEAGLKTDDFDLEAAGFAVGVSTFPETAWLLEKGAELKQAAGPSFQLEILPLYDEKSTSGDIRDIRPPYRFVPWLWLLLGAAAAACAAWVVYRRYAVRKISGPAAEPADTRSPYEKALAAIDSLAASRLWEEGKIKEFYTSLTGIFRTYLDAQFGIKAELMTTSRITKELRNTGTDIRIVIQTREMLEKSDLAKFAKLMPEAKDRDADISLLRELLLFYSQKAEAREAEAARAAAEARR